MRNKYSFKWVPGSIRSLAEVQDLLDCGKLDNETIILYGVCQSGYIEKWHVPVGANIEIEEAQHFSYTFEKLVGVRLFYDDGRLGNHDSYIMLGDRGVSSEGKVPASENHRLFSNLRCATEYSEWMKNDPDYIAGVKAHWARCARWERLFDDYDDNYDY